MEKPFSAYRGNGPYVFVCYAHRDSDAVYREIAWLKDNGVNLWYDEGISPGQEWTDELANAIQGCAKVIYFVTPNSVITEHCRRELNFAQEENREVVAIHLQPTDVPAGLRLSLNNRQAVFKHGLSDDEYRKQLIRAAHVGGGPAPRPAAEADARRRRFRRVLTLGVVALTVIAGVGWWATTHDQPSADAETIAAPESESAQSPEVLHNSIAVLPFDNLSPNPDHEYFAAGIHGEILNQLSKIHDLSVIARTTMIRYADSNKSVPEIGRELSVETVMEGSVRYAGNRVRITAQLIDTKSGAQLWSEAYEERLEDIFGIQLAIASQLANQMEAEFSVAEQASIGKSITNNTEAYAYYLQAVSRAGNFSARGPVHEALEAAIALDPDFAQALAFNAKMYQEQSELPRFLDSEYSVEKVEQYSSLAQDYATRALELDPTLAIAHYVLGDFEHALSLNPSDYRIISGLGSLRIWFQGRADEGIRLLARSIELNPADAANIWWVSQNLAWLQRWDDAIYQARSAVRMAPDAAFTHANLALLAAFSDNTSLARSSAAMAEALNPGPYALADIARTYGRLGNQQEALRLYEQALAEGQGAPNDPYWQFNIHVAIGKYGAAMDYLEQTVQEGVQPIPISQLGANSAHPMFDEVRDDPRFDGLVRSLGGVTR